MFVTFMQINAWAQISTASFNGTVQDKTRAPLPGAAVVVENVATGVKRSAATDADGYYSIPLLQPGSYHISVSLTGFATLTKREMPLLVNQIAKVDFTLEVAGLEQTIEVTAAAPMLEASTSSLGTVVEQRRIVDLPLNGRQFTQLLVLTPGVAPVNVSQNGSLSPILGAGSIIPSVNGQQNRSNMFFMDGMYNSDPFLSGYTISPSVDAIQEFKVQSHIDQAEFGQVMGGIVNLVTKSGTDRLHGSVYEFHRNDNLDARNFFDARRPEFKQNQFGFTTGGPIRKGNTWFFGGYEGFRSSRGSAVFSRIPTPAEISGDFRGHPPIFNPYTTRPDPNNPGQFIRDPFPNNVIPQELLNAGNRFWISKFIPAPNRTDPGPNFVNTQSRVTDQDQFSVRADHQLTSKDMIYGRFSFSDTTIGSPVQLPVNRTDNFYNGRNAVLNWTHTFNPKLITHFSVGYNE
ncbi:MAG: carboxypeptidase regulatory-like domain-containing protein [Acidobacteria bacterium]|nr:carboxypeptidase regulatory-like domain-containing protein [Acidobacteriota bacterium]